MIFKRINLYAQFNLKRRKGAKGFLNAYIHSSSKYYPNRIRPAIVVIAGGGYSGICERESEPVALAFFGKGYNVFTLEYSCKPFSYPTQLVEGCMSIAYIRRNADLLKVNKEHVAVVGFSAGGHLATMTATLFDEESVKNIIRTDGFECKPNAIILGYPVISSGEFAHIDSINNLIGGDRQLLEKVSLENRVKENTCPAFIWGTVDDDLVPSENSLLLALAYKRNSIPFELHMYSNGHHGLGLADIQTATPFGRVKDSTIEEYVKPEIQGWFDMALVWLNKRGFVIEDLR
jgi:acetyl esterase/lipase